MLMTIIASVGGRSTAIAGEEPLETRNVVIGLAPGDTLKITTYGELTLTGDFVISPAGTISFPLIGVVKAAGFEVPAIQKALTTALADGYVLDPKVTVDVAHFRPVYILGEVNKPGEYPFALGLTVRGAVAKADGFTYRANEKRAFIKGASETAEHSYKLTADIPVAPGDTLRIGERYF
ncbi:MAG: polysaccharide export protein [Alphaproteobacteria bacterium]|nr:polysaccharide export protein [Alphaproteobacteria bacterium]